MDSRKKWTWASVQYYYRQIDIGSSSPGQSESFDLSLDGLAFHPHVPGDLRCVQMAFSLSATLARDSMGPKPGSSLFLGPSPRPFLARPFHGGANAPCVHCRGPSQLVDIYRTSPEPSEPCLIIEDTPSHHPSSPFH